MSEPAVTGSSGRRTPRKGVGLLWAGVDQVVSSLVNFGGSALAARTLAPDEFGLFAIGFAIYVFALGLSRSVTSEVLVATSASRSRMDQRSEVAIAAGTSLTIGVGLAATLSIFGLVLGGQSAGLLLVVGALLPLMLVQDFVRYALVLQRRQLSAAINDGLWMIVLIAGFVVFGPLVNSGQSAFILWAAGSLVGAIVGLFQMNTVPRCVAREWIKRHHQHVKSYLGEFALLSAGGYLMSPIIAATSGLTQTAGYRGGQVLLSPINLLHVAARLQVTPILVGRSAREPARRLAAYCIAVSAVGVLASVMWGLTILAIPDGLGVQILGESWYAVRPLLPLFILHHLVKSSEMGAIIGVRSFGPASLGLKVRVLSAPAVVGFGILGAFNDGARGALIGLIAGHLVAAPMWWIALLRASKQRSELARVAG